MNDMEKNKKLIVYSAANAHGYLTCIVHRLLFNKDSYAVYIGDDCTAKRTGGLELFSDYILYKQIAGDYGYKNDLAPEDYEKFLISYFDEELKKHGIHIEQVSEWYIGSNWSDFPIYINLKSIKHNIFQEAIGDLGLSKECWAIRYPCQFDARKKTGMFDGLNNKNIIKAFVHPATIKQSNNKVVIFDIVKEMRRLSGEDKTKLKSLFHIPTVNYLDDTRVLLLTQWFRMQGEIWNDNEIIKMYTLLLDLYSNIQLQPQSRIIIKPHPADPQKNNYVKYISSAYVYSVPFPSECLGLLSDSGFDLAITVSSSSINTVESISKKRLSIKFFEQFYTIAPQFYFCARVIKLLSLKCFYFGIFKEVMEPLVSQNKGFLPDSVTWHRIDETPLPEEGGLILYDNIWREGIVRTSLSKLYNSPDNSLCFIVTDNIENFIQTSEDATYTDYLFKLSLAIRPYADNSIYLTSKEKYIYIFSKNKDLISKLKNLNLTMVLPFSKIVLMEGKLDQGDMPLQLKQNFILKNLNK